MASSASESSLDDLSNDDAWETELEIALLSETFICLLFAIAVTDSAHAT